MFPDFSPGNNASVIDAVPAEQTQKKETGESVPATAVVKKEPQETDVNAFLLLLEHAEALKGLVNPNKILSIHFKSQDIDEGSGGESPVDQRRQSSSLCPPVDLPLIPINVTRPRMRCAWRQPRSAAVEQALETHLRNKEVLRSLLTSPRGSSGKGSDRELSSRGVDLGNVSTIADAMDPNGLNGGASTRASGSEPPKTSYPRPPTTVAGSSVAPTSSKEQMSRSPSLRMRIGKNSSVPISS